MAGTGISSTGDACRHVVQAGRIRWLQSPASYNVEDSYSSVAAA